MDTYSFGGVFSLGPGPESHNLPYLLPSRYQLWLLAQWRGGTFFAIHQRPGFNQYDV